MVNRKIVVIDDSRVVRSRVRGMLPRGNFEVLEAKDGLEGLNLIRKERPNLILLDFLLPKLSGWEVFQQIQQNAELQKIPLVLMSGRKEEVTEKIQEPFEHFEFILKPFDQKELILAIKSAITKVKHSSATPARTTPMAQDDIQTLNDKIVKMQAEIDTLKQQLSQILMFVQHSVE